MGHKAARAMANEEVNGSKTTLSPNYQVQWRMNTSKAKEVAITTPIVHNGRSSEDMSAVASDQKLKMETAKRVGKRVGFLIFKFIHECVKAL